MDTDFASPCFPGNVPLDVEIHEQAFDEALDPDNLERLGRYELHLDRKLERTLGMVIRLRDLRRDNSAD